MTAPGEQDGLDTDYTRARAEQIVAQTELHIESLDRPEALRRS